MGPGAGLLPVLLVVGDQLLHCLLQVALVSPTPAVTSGGPLRTVVLGHPVDLADAHAVLRDVDLGMRLVQHSVARFQAHLPGHHPDGVHVLVPLGVQRSLLLRKKKGWATATALVAALCRFACVSADTSSTIPRS